MGADPRVEQGEEEQPWDSVVFEKARRAGYLLARHLGCTADEALDAVQDASERAWRYRHSLNGKFEPWFLAIVNRTASRPKLRWMPLRNWDKPVESMLTAFDPALIEALKRLPARQRAALWLHYGEDMSVSDVAQVMRMRESAAKQLLYRSRNALRRELSNE